MADRASTTMKKKAYLEALEKSLGVQAEAMKAAQVKSRLTIKYWKRDDPDFAQAVEDIIESSIDFAESALFRSIKEGNTTAIIFYLKTRGKHRGYVERVEQTGKDGQPLNPSIEVEIIDKREQVKNESSDH